MTLRQLIENHGMNLRMRKVEWHRLAWFEPILLQEFMAVGKHYDGEITYYLLDDDKCDWILYEECDL